MNSPGEQYPAYNSIRILVPILIYSDCDVLRHRIDFDINAALVLPIVMMRQPPATAFSWCSKAEILMRLHFKVNHFPPSPTLQSSTITTSSLAIAYSRYLTTSRFSFNSSLFAPCFYVVSLSQTKYLEGRQW
jgi:hypothetical protein